jgi:hypothetical protein
MLKTIPLDLYSPCSILKKNPRHRNSGKHGLILYLIYLHKIIEGCEGTTKIIYLEIHMLL